MSADNQSESALPAGIPLYVGTLLITAATLLFELLLTRIFSVTMWYHYAFMAISLAMFGMTVGAIVVFVAPRLFESRRVHESLTWSSAAFSVTTLAAFAFHAQYPTFGADSEVDHLAVGVTFLVISIPFIFGGICVTLLLTRFPGQISRIYAVDLAGAALGCLGMVALLDVTDGPTAVIVVATLMAAAAVCFSVPLQKLGVLISLLVLTTLLGSFAYAHGTLAADGAGMIRLESIKGRAEPEPQFERWNSFSRVSVLGNPEVASEPFGWSLSAAWPGGYKIPQLWLLIDSSAGTPLTKFDGDLKSVDYLRYDLVNLVHEVRPESDVLVVGAGGGRDILSALAFEQASVTAVEINDSIVAALTGPFGDFTGHLDQRPEVTLVNDEARSFIARQDPRFDIIQISLIDTWAATAAGAFALSENTLYTVEAWRSFLDTMRPGGVLSVSRWYFEGLPGETYRIVALAHQALAGRGVRDTRQHILLARHRRTYDLATDSHREGPDGVGTLLVSNAPLSPQDVARFRATVERLGFDLMLAPGHAADPNLAAITDPAAHDAFVAGYELNIAAPTDDDPFFFHMLRFGDALGAVGETADQGVVSFNVKAVSVLGTLLLTVMVLTLLFILGPLFWATRRSRGEGITGAAPLLTMFGLIGLAFMLVEISQLQRLSIFLGHPVYSLVVVLFSLLLASGIGSWTTSGVDITDRKSIRWRLGYLLATVLIFGVLTPSLTQAFDGATTPIRVTIAVGCLFPMGIGMGMLFPLGMKLALRRWPHLAPWMWGINGATGVCASVLAIAVSLTMGISTAFWMGFVCYALACVTFLRAEQRASA